MLRCADAVMGVFVLAIACRELCLDRDQVSKRDAAGVTREIRSWGRRCGLCGRPPVVVALIPRGVRVSSSSSCSTSRRGLATPSCRIRWPWQLRPVLHANVHLILFHESLGLSGAQPLERLAREYWIIHVFCLCHSQIRARQPITVPRRAVRFICWVGACGMAKNFAHMSQGIRRRAAHELQGLTRLPPNDIAAAEQCSYQLYPGSFRGTNAFEHEVQHHEQRCLPQNPERKVASHGHLRWCRSKQATKHGEGGIRMPTLV